jgi:glycosyltransferase involved in cell wall biosynthesis
MGLSIVVPVYNEAASLPELYGRIGEACRSMARPFEVVFVDDGSTDGSGALLDRMAEVDERITVIHFRRNFGKSPALAAAFERVVGPIVITMDADLQDDPAMIPAFVERIEAGADLVSGWKQRRNDPLDKTLPSKLFNAVVRRVSGVPLRDFNCGFKAYRVECIRELNVYGGLHRFLPVLAGERGFRIEELVVVHHPRKHGTSKFGARRFVDGFLDLLTVLLLTRYRMKPLHFFGAAGGLAGVVGISILAYLTVLWCLGYGIGTRPLLTFGVLLTLTSGQFLGLGLLGELLVRTTVDRREVFSVRGLREGRQGKPDTSAPDPFVLEEEVSAEAPAADRTSAATDA